MKIKVRSKKRIIMWCSIIVVMVLNLAFALNKRSLETVLQDEKLRLSKTQIALAADKEGSITVEENKYYKKYVIECTNIVKEINWEENKESIHLHLEKQDVDKLNLRAEKNVKSDDISYDGSSDNIDIKIKKIYDKNNFVYVDSTNNRNIVVLVAKEENPFNHTVVLDAGHGGVDKGANLGSIYEKDITLKIIKYTAEELKFNGIKVVLTRDSDKLLSLREIGDIANDASGDVFVSVHVNENKESKFKGITTYYYDPNGYQKDDRIKLAKTIQKELIKSDDWEDRGILRQNLAVLRYSEIPCVLLECGFLSNPEDREKLKNESVLNNLSKNITKGIMNYLGAE